ncbi:hypothetical protein WG66_006021, partial [Moniliophthora roreri]
MLRWRSIMVAAVINSHNQVVIPPELGYNTFRFLLMG